MTTPCCTTPPPWTGWTTTGRAVSPASRSPPGTRSAPPSPPANWLPWAAPSGHPVRQILARI
ncbi:hypothetical protein LT493_34790 [Streptomyces tricolor]|nr:hypothetical protein [Streptomyces tricolor]